MDESMILKFRCRLVSSFHTTQHTHRNLLRGEAWILGSSLRGVILGSLIQTCCSEKYLKELITRKLPVDIQAYHRSCSEDCPLRDFAGERDWLPVFSFGFFPVDCPRRMRYRIGVNRELRTVATGNLASVEVVPEGTEFNFAITLPRSGSRHRGQIERAVCDVGRCVGLGRYKSVGMGRFEVAGVEEVSVASELATVRSFTSGLSANLRLRFVTHFVLQNEATKFPTDSYSIRWALAEALASRTSEIKERFGLPFVGVASNIPIPACRISFRPDYVSRHSFEEGRRKNALVALPGSWLDVSFGSLDEALLDQLAIAQLFGVGPWADAGFGRLRPEPAGG